MARRVPTRTMPCMWVLWTYPPPQAQFRFATPHFSMILTSVRQLGSDIRQSGGVC